MGSSRHEMGFRQIYRYTTFLYCMLWLPSSRQILIAQSRPKCAASQALWQQRLRFHLAITLIRRCLDINISDYLHSEDTKRNQRALLKVSTTGLDSRSTITLMRHTLYSFDPSLRRSLNMR